VSLSLPCTRAQTLLTGYSYLRRFGDIHYFYSGPEVKPRHHRFDKGSYVYLFENANERRCRIEIANHAGTPDQDAFDGCK
jgi:hypothetical protein